ncbi:MAG: carbohydrate ABC transporter substrate-binding protein, partial [Oscillospiraceae bacterium]|nr:carbohydrate ABC transporter substrate-binding protein [Oscillospiraceae bacterium]
TLSMEEIGLTYDDTEDMYEYTRQVATDDNGELRGVSWQATPGVFAYKRSVAREVLGTDDPAAVQEYVSSWSRFEDTAAFMKDNGYRMLSSIDSSFRVFNTNKTTPWVDDDNTIIISDEALEWVRMQKDFFYNGYTNGYTVWSEGWIDDMTPYSNAFGFFLPTWGVNFTLKGYTGEEGYGDWAICEGPAPYYWGGTWLAASYQTDNKELVADIFRTMCSDDDIMEDIATEDNILDYTNNIDVMDELSYSDHYDSFLGGQNSFAVFHENALDVDLSCLTPYDSTLDQLFIDCMREYILGNMTFDDALDEFYEEVITHYPALSIPGVRPSCP